MDQPDEMNLAGESGDRLAWLIQSAGHGEVEAQRALLEMCAPAVEQLLDNWLGDTPQVTDAIVMILAGLLARADQYDGRLDGLVWLARQTFELVAQHFPEQNQVEVMGETVHAPVVPLEAWIAQAFRLSPIQTAECMRSSLDYAEQLLAKLPQDYSRLARAIKLRENQADLVQQALGQHEQQRGKRRWRVRLAESGWVLGLVLALVLLIYWMNPLMIPEDWQNSTGVSAQRTRTPTPVPTNAYYFTVQNDMSVAQLSEIVGLSPQNLARMNGLKVDSQLEAGQEIIVGVGSQPFRLITPTPVTPVADYPPILSENSSADEVKRRMMQARSLFRTVWIEYQIFEYGPPHYIGEPLIYREQLWYSQPNYYRHISGWMDGEVQSATVYQAGTTAARYWNTADWQSIQGPDDALPGFGQVLLPDEGLWNEINGYSAQVKGTAQVAGRECLILEINLPFSYTPDSEGFIRLWVDRQVGFVLRMQIQYDVDFMAMEAIVTHLELDQNIPNILFELYQPVLPRFASNSQGTPLVGAELAATPSPDWTLPAGRVPRTRTNPSPGFDVRTADLAFEMVAENDMYEGPYTYAIFADNFFLGELHIAQSGGTELMCSRSKSGLFAYVERTYGSEFASRVYWLDLDAFQSIHELPGFENQNVLSLAFSPDGTRLATYACPVSGMACSLIVVNIQTEETQTVRLETANYGGAVTWSPDGSSLAVLVEAPDAVPSNNLWAIDLATGEVIYRGGYDYEADRFPDDFPEQFAGIESIQFNQSILTCGKQP